LAYLRMVCPYKQLRKLSKWRTKEVSGLKNYSVDPFTVHLSLIRNGLHGRVAVKKPFLRKGNREKRLRYAR